MAKKKNNILENFLNVDYKGDEMKFNRIMLLDMLVALVLAVFGFLISSEKMTSFMGIRVSLGIMALLNVCICFMAFSKYRNNRLFILNILFSVLYLISAVLLFTNLLKLDNSLIIYTGIYMIISGLKYANYGYLLFKVKESSYLFTLATAVIDIILAGLLIFYPFGNFDVFEIVGIFVILYSILTISSSNLLRNRVCQFMSKVDNN